MSEEATPGALGSNAGLGHIAELVACLRDNSGRHINGLYDKRAADELERLAELADSEGSRAVQYLRRARKVEAEVALLRAELAKFTPLRAKGVVDADDNLDCWDTNPYELCTRHVAALNEKDPAAMWRVVDLFARNEG